MPELRGTENNVMEVALPRNRREGAPSLEIDGLSKSFGQVKALDAVRLTIEPGEVRALLGENGSGKSTLIKVLSGYHGPDAGTVKVGGHLLPSSSPEESARLGCRFVHQDLGLIDELSVIDNLALGNGFPTRFGTVRGRLALETARTELAEFAVDVDPQQPVKQLSAAQRTGVAIVRAMRGGADGGVRLLVLDEPTATLPVGETEMLFSLIRRVTGHGASVIYVTHRLEEVFQIADSVTVLRDGQLIGTSPTAQLDHRAIVRLLLGEEMDEPNVDASTYVGDDGSDRGPGVTIEVTDLRAPSLGGVSFSARAGEIVGFAGITGSGREAILAAIFGATLPEAGAVTVGGHTLRPGRPDLAMAAGLAYLPGDRKKLGDL